MYIYSCVSTLVYMYSHMYTHIFTHLLIHIHINTCVYTHRGIISSYPRSLSHFDTLSLCLPLSLLHVRSLFHFVPLSAPPHTRTSQSDINTGYTQLTCAVCARSMAREMHDRGRKKPTPRVRRGFELQHAATRTHYLAFISFSLPPPLSLAFSLPLIH